MMDFNSSSSIAGQVSAVAGIMAELGIDDIAMAGVAKGVDRDAVF